MAIDQKSEHPTDYAARIMSEAEALAGIGIVALTERQLTALGHIEERRLWRIECESYRAMALAALAQLAEIEQRAARKRQAARES